MLFLESLEERVLLSVWSPPAVASSPAPRAAHSIAPMQNLQTQPALDGSAKLLAPGPVVAPQVLPAPPDGWQAQIDPAGSSPFSDAPAPVASPGTGSQSAPFWARDNEVLPARGPVEDFPDPLPLLKVPSAAVMTQPSPAASINSSAPAGAALTPVLPSPPPQPASAAPALETPAQAPANDVTVTVASSAAMPKPAAQTPAAQPPANPPSLLATDRSTVTPTQLGALQSNAPRISQIAPDAAAGSWHQDGSSIFYVGGRSLGSAFRSELVMATVTALNWDFTAHQSLATVMNLQARTRAESLVVAERLLLADAMASARIAGSIVHRIYDENTMLWKEVVGLLGATILLGGYALKKGRDPRRAQPRTDQACRVRRRISGEMEGTGRLHIIGAPPRSTV
jgi:hypothetical protein